LETLIGDKIYTKWRPILSPHMSLQLETKDIKIGDKNDVGDLETKNLKELIMQAMLILDTKDFSSL
jgi:hypothetical protein